MVSRCLFGLAMVVVGSMPVTAQDSLTSPYTRLQDRDIKALAPADVDGLLNGDGMSLALAAELNGYPGPRHVLDLADSLGISGDQVQNIRKIFDAMQADARAIGQQVVQTEKELDQLFASRSIDAERLNHLTAQIAELQGRLRFVHLRAHLSTTPLLTQHQRAEYQRLRGYHTDGHGGHHLPN